MGNKKQKSKKKSELKVIFFIILISAVLFIISTYAWFSTQRNVSITNLSGIVEVAEGLEISLDALNWSNEIVLGEDMNIMDNAYEGHHNISPSELLPVSTLALVNTDTTNNKLTDLRMMRGTVNNSIRLKDILFMNEQEADSEDPAYPGYFAFDIFLKNSSNIAKSQRSDKADELQLNYDSLLQIVEGGNQDVGLQNTARIALVKYGVGATVENNEVVKREGVSDVMANQQTILRETGAVADGDTVYMTDATIWEPNSDDHAEYIVTNNNKITWNSTYAAIYNTKELGGGVKGFDLTAQMPTYALKDTAATTSGVVIEDIYFWDEDDTTPAETDGDGAFSSHLQEQMTLKTTKTSTEDYKIKEGVQFLFSTRSAPGETDKEENRFTIAPNSVIRLRVYVWLEGQDVDCINYASHGGGVTINLGLVKGSTEGATADDVDLGTE